MHPYSGNLWLCLLSRGCCFTSSCSNYCFGLNDCLFGTDQNVNLIAKHTHDRFFSFLPSSSTVDESGSGQPEGMDMVVCRAPGGEFYVEGETWNLDECTRCTCRKGRVLCDTEVCPPALCQTPIRNKDTCCHVCPGNRKQTRVQESRGNFRKKPGGRQKLGQLLERNKAVLNVLSACGFERSCMLQSVGQFYVRHTDS